MLFSQKTVKKRNFYDFYINYSISAKMV